MRNSFLILSALLISLNAIAFQGDDPIIIIKKFITYNKKRQELSLEYLKLRHGLNKSTPTIDPKIIVLHYTAGGTLESNFRYFDKTEIEESRTVIRGQSNLNVSSHYLIDRDGRIYQLMDDHMFARHVIGLNYCAIGVENVGGKEAPLTDKQVVANIQLVRHLKNKFPAIEYLIGHSEYIQFRNHALWKETNDKYITYKSDPGDAFMRKVREGLKELQLRSKP